MHLENGVQVVTNGTRFSEIDVMSPSRIAADLSLCGECETVYRVGPGWKHVKGEDGVKFICPSCVQRQAVEVTHVPD